MNGFKDLSQVGSRIFSYTSPCQIEVESLIVSENEGKSRIQFKYYSKNQLIVSMFFNVTEQENQQVNLTENLRLSETNSY